jgi:hypothetical protein
MKNSKVQEVLRDLTGRLKAEFPRDNGIMFNIARDFNNIIFHNASVIIGSIEIKTNSTAVFVFPEYREQYYGPVCLALIKNGFKVHGKEARKRLNEGRGTSV